MENYVIIGLVFSCISLLYNMLFTRYVVLNMYSEIESKKTERSILIEAHNIVIFGLMFAWLLCWPALIIFKIIKFMVWIIKLLIWKNR